VEDAENYFLKCKIFTEQNGNLSIATRPYHPLSKEKQLVRNPLLIDSENEFVFHETQKFIKHTEILR
jgi:hypothetical protein